MAKDYDICNDYGETDVVVDLFDEIDRAYLGVPSKVFDNIAPSDFVIGFFPCTRFEAQIHLSFMGKAHQLKNYSDLQKLQYDLYLHKGLTDNYERVTKLAIICLRKGVPLVLENPNNEPHYLTRYWGVEPKVIDLDRRKDGDRQKKPTKYWFFNCEPKNNLVFEPLELVEQRTHNYITGNRQEVQTLRSEIHPQYANRFIKKYIADYKDGEWIL